MVTCNGTPIPLRETTVRGEYVAGVTIPRLEPSFRTASNLGTDVPLVFDLVDTWNNRSIGGCTYYVAHPGGRNYDTFPVNAYEAEGRRISRFWSEGHTQGPITPVSGLFGYRAVFGKEHDYKEI